MNKIMINKSGVFLLTGLLLLTGCTAKVEEKPKPVASQETAKENKPAGNGTTIPATEKKDETDPYQLSFKSSSLLFDSDLRNILSSSELEYCSHIIERPGSNDLTITWNLKSDDAEVYRCDYSYDSDRKYKERSITACKISEAYERYQNGDKALIRDYVMPEKDDDIDMFVYKNRSDYYEEYFILGKYSDMYCYIQGEDIYFEYYWYQNTENGPVLVYESTAKNTTTTSGKRYREDLWELFEGSAANIDIIPYKDYPREYDYYEVYDEWERQERERNSEELLEEYKEIYCACEDEDELYSEYKWDFDSWEEAVDFWEENCE